MRIFFVAFFLGFVFVQCPLEAFSCINEWDYESAALIFVSYELQSFSQLPWIYQTLRPELVTHSNHHSPIDSRVEEGILKILFCVGRSELVNDKALILDLGPRSFSLKARPVDWGAEGLSNNKGKRIVEGHMTSIVLFDQARPNWVILRSARLLNAENGEAIVEIVIQNLSPVDSPIGSVKIHAMSPGGHCFSGSDPMQDVVLEWDRILATGGSDGAWTLWGTTPVKVRASYSFRGRCNPRSFEATVPVQQTVASNGSTRITMRLRQLPKGESNRRSLDVIFLSMQLPNLEIPSPILSWDAWTVAVGSDIGVWPETLAISRQ